MEVMLTRDVHKRLLDEARRALPNECCGLLLGAPLERGAGQRASGRGGAKGQADGAQPRAARDVLPADHWLVADHPITIADIRPAKNIHPEPQRHFTLDPQVLIDAQRAARGGGARVLGYYHSHPGGAPRPSKTDQAMAHGDDLIWAIIGLPMAGVSRSSGDTQGYGAELGLWQDSATGFVPLAYHII